MKRTIDDDVDDDGDENDERAPVDLRDVDALRGRYRRSAARGAALRAA